MRIEDHTFMAPTTLDFIVDINELFFLSNALPANGHFFRQAVTKQFGFADSLFCFAALPVTILLFECYRPALQTAFAEHGLVESSWPPAGSPCFLSSGRMLKRHTVSRVLATAGVTHVLLPAQRSDTLYLAAPRRIAGQSAEVIDVPDSDEEERQEDLASDRANGKKKKESSGASESWTRRERLAFLGFPQTEDS